MEGGRGEGGRERRMRRREGGREGRRAYRGLLLAGDDGGSGVGDFFLLHVAEGA